ncbi:hypothetical protein L4X63_12410 [Geomonas sp. Red32]|uniref:hypothetical protein n=1 Tax=Geomonas sp. Red32 TaxID=2912856 RepID=UPI00202CD9F6|nr:hypothetical protein [Geomonas sp. Red32]MCM0082392.1 hypothetical protein [Geomonas sp. Red32]
MSALVHFGRVIPLVFPEIFPNTSCSIFDTTVKNPTPGADLQPSPGTADLPWDSQDEMRARRMKSLYQRSLRTQRHSDGLTYSGLRA